MTKIKLNSEQKKAVRHSSGPLLIIAGAGTGKTTVITEKIKYLIAKKNASPSEILALTFTEKAAQEMQGRVDESMPYGYTQMWISTFHSFCDRILRNEAVHIGLDPNYKINTQSESIQFIRKNIFDFKLDYFRPRGNPTKFVLGMLQHFSRLQDEDIDSSAYLNWVKKLKNASKNGSSKEDLLEIKKWNELSLAYQKYSQLKEKEGIFDFGDLITNTLRLLRERPNILKKLRQDFKWVLVDEFQDTNIAQYELIKLLCPLKKTPNLTVVGDDSQSIYKFRGAAISNILFFKKEYKNSKTIVLTKNYRSTQTILDSAYQLIRFNSPDTLEDKIGINKNLISVYKQKNEPEIEFIHADRVEGEADLVAKKIKSLIEEKKYKPKDVAILVRANNHSEPFSRALLRHSIPYQFLGPGKLFKQKEIVDLISYLKVLDNFEDSVSMYRLLSIDYFDFDTKDVIRIVNYAKRHSYELFETCKILSEEKSSNQIYISSNTRKKLGEIIKIIERHQKLIFKENAGQLLYFFLEESGLLQNLLRPDSVDAERKAKNISKFFDKLKSFETSSKDSSVSGVVNWIDLASELGESPLASDSDWEDVNAVNILTVHSSKGLEFPVVFLVNLVSQRFPTVQRRENIPIPKEMIKEILPEGDYHVQEERRLFYVGMTRAKKALFFTASSYYGEGKREKKLSPFIYEALGDDFSSSRSRQKEGEQLSFLDYRSRQKGDQKTKISKKKTDHINIDYLSYSQIETYRICPLHYKLRYIYKLPTPPSSSQSFGNSFHLVMKDIYESTMQKVKINKKLIKNLLEKNWINDGYLNRSHERSSFNKAYDFLVRYMKESYNPKIKPISMEQPFMIRLPISEKDGSFLRVGGKIDRIDKHKNYIEIIDYKTGANPLSQREADSNLQLSIYALAATEIPQAPFGKKPENVKLSLYYFDPPSIVSTERDGKQLEIAKKQIVQFKKEIENSDFKCSKGIICQNCEFKLFCQNEED